MLITSQITETEKKSHYLVYHKSDNWNREEKFVDTEEEIRSRNKGKNIKMTKRKQKTMIYKTPHIKLKFEEPEPHKVIGMKTGVPVVSLLSKSKKGRHCDYDKQNLLIKLKRHNTYTCTIN